MSRFLSGRFVALEAYTPGEQPRDKRYIKLNTNESPYPPSKEVMERISKEEVMALNLYPDPTGRALKEKLAALYEVNTEQVFLANGSDEILNFAFLAFCDAQNGAVFPDISYGFYPVYAKLYQIPFEEIPLKEDFSIDSKAYCGLNRMIVIANPNAPTGMALSVGQIEEIVKSNPDHVVLIDEAYVDFGGESCIGLTKKYGNLLVVQTFSKSRSMAGARLGFGIAQAELIADLKKIQYSTNPYNINRLTLAAGEAAVESDAYYKENAKRIIETREKTAKELRELGVTVLPSKANFIFAGSGRLDGDSLYRELKAQGILVRHFEKERIRNFVRISIGTPGQMEALVSAFQKILAERRERP
ncbi:MAG: histidinol-phosphate transaminase [Lachnospiraceae bacterium]|nr:histidinol-phosphate transaminase [Lachnospiraceae bacterium]